MASSIELKLTNRSPKKPIKKLPSRVQLQENGTIDELKVAIAEACGIGDYNRVGIFDPATNKTFKNRQAKVADEVAIVKVREVLVKDLGPQLGWRTSYVMEYVGPLVIHPAIIAARRYIYPGSPAPTALSKTQWLSFSLLIFHFTKRQLETIFVHKFSANTMPWSSAVKNSTFYWLVGGLGSAYSIYHPQALAAKTGISAVSLGGAVLYAFGQTGNARVHWYLSSLRSSGSTERTVPIGYGFSLMTCPNYMYEIIAWIGLSLVSRDWTVAVFTLFGARQMYIWGKAKEKAYRKEFGDRYTNKRYVLFPGLF